METPLELFAGLEPEILRNPVMRDKYEYCRSFEDTHYTQVQKKNAERIKELEEEASELSRKLRIVMNYYIQRYQWFPVSEWGNPVSSGEYFVTIKGFDKPAIAYFNGLKWDTSDVIAWRIMFYIYEEKE